MISKKMRMTLGILLVFLLLSSVVASAVSRLDVRWGGPFGIGAFLMAVAIVPLFFARRHPWTPIVTLVLNVVSCGLLVGSFYVAKSLPLSFRAATFSPCSPPVAMRSPYSFSASPG